MPAVVRLTSVDLVIGGKHLLRGIDWNVDQGDHWVVLGPNGAGKTTLLRLVAGYAHPTRGRVEVLGGTLGRTDVRRLRTHVGYLSPHLGDMFAAQISALDVVTGARSASTYSARHHDPPLADVVKAEALLERLGCGALVDRELGTLSAGERKRVLIARSLLVDPAILVLDEPGAALDLGGRELLVETLSELATAPGGPVLILVSHHVEMSHCVA